MKIPGNMKLAVTILLAAALCGCGSAVVRDSKRLASSADKWVGHTVDELIVANGEPLNVYRSNSGGRVFEYPMDIASNKSQARTQKNYPKKGGGYPCKIHFVVSATDIVESWTVEGDKCN